LMMALIFRAAACSHSQAKLTTPSRLALLPCLSYARCRTHSLLTQAPKPSLFQLQLQPHQTRLFGIFSRQFHTHSYAAIKPNASSSATKVAWVEEEEVP